MNSAIKPQAVHTARDLISSNKSHPVRAQKDDPGREDIENRKKKKLSVIKYLNKTIRELW